MSSELLVAKGIRKRFGARKVLEGVDLSLTEKDLLMLFGENGSGKSTLLQIIVGVLVPGAGAVTIGGHSLERERVQALAHVGFAPERADIPEHLLVIEWLDLVASLKCAERPTDEMLATWGVEPLLRTRVGSLSLGQHRRVVLLSAQLGRPRLLVLDEPTNGLDAALLTTLESELRRHASGGGAVLCATHDEAFAGRMGTRRIELRAGVVGAVTA
jgi:ABC-type multidrug transport system ATPase subunit